MDIIVVDETGKIINSTESNVDVFENICNTLEKDFPYHDRFIIKSYREAFESGITFYKDQESKIPYRKVIVSS